MDTEAEEEGSQNGSVDAPVTAKENVFPVFQKGAR